VGAPRRTSTTTTSLGASHRRVSAEPRRAPGHAGAARTPGRRARRRRRRSRARSGCRRLGAAGSPGDRPPRDRGCTPRPGRAAAALDRAPTSQRAAEVLDLIVRSSLRSGELDEAGQHLRRLRERAPSHAAIPSLELDLSRARARDCEPWSAPRPPRSNAASTTRPSASLARSSGAGRRARSRDARCDSAIFGAASRRSTTCARRSSPRSRARTSTAPPRASHRCAPCRRTSMTSSSHCARSARRSPRASMKATSPRPWRPSRPANSVRSSRGGARSRQVYVNDSGTRPATRPSSGSTASTRPGTATPGPSRTRCSHYVMW
jgi:hypothetical protein